MNPLESKIEAITASLTEQFHPTEFYTLKKSKGIVGIGPRVNVPMCVFVSGALRSISEKERAACLLKIKPFMTPESERLMAQV